MPRTATIKRSRLLGKGDQGSLISAIIRGFGYLNRGERYAAVLIFAATFFNAVLNLVGLAGVLPFFKLLTAPDPLAKDSLLGRAFQSVGIADEFTAIMVTGACLVVLIVAKNVFGVFHVRITGRFCARIETRLAKELLDRVVHAPFAWYLQQNTSVLRDAIMSHVVEWARGIIRTSLSLANSVLMILVGIGLLIPLTPLPAIVVTGMLIAMGGALIRFARPKLTLAGGRKRNSSLLAGVAATEAVTGGRDVRMSRAGVVLLEEFGRDYAIYAHSDADARQWQAVPRYGMEIIGFSAIIVIAVGALLSGIDRFETASILALYAVVAVRLVPTISEASSALSMIQVSLPTLFHLDTLQRELPAPRSRVAGEAGFETWSEVVLDHVHYRYGPAAKDALSGIDLVLQRGRSYGLVGSSGAGKSTLADVVAGLLLATEGRLLIDDKPLTDEVGIANWRHHVAYVAQSPLIFDASLADNIVLGGSQQDRDTRLLAAIEASGLGPVVAALERGVDTPIGDRGVRLSGGQRQRVAIARSLYQNSDLLILDEATSALDSLTDREVVDEIEALKGKVTLLTIAHRLSTVARCDEIIVLEQGRIIARGSHSALIENSQRYREFAAQQFVESRSLAANPSPVKSVN